MSNRIKGTVKWFNASKGFGFITTESDGDVFVHYSSIRDHGGYRSLEEGQEVECMVVAGDRGPQAKDVVAI